MITFNPAPFSHFKEDRPLDRDTILELWALRHDQPSRFGRMLQILSIQPHKVRPSGKHQLWTWGEFKKFQIKFGND